MDEMYRKLFSTMHQFQKLRFGDMFPELTRGDCMTLMAINRFNKEKEDGILTVSELAEKMEVQSPAVSRTLKTLEDKGFIERTIKKSDRRNTYVEVTAEGKREIKEMEETMSDFARTVITRMNEEDMKKLITYLDELYRVAKEEIDLRKIRVRKDKEV